jgi:glycine cleavage system H protein
MISIRAPFLLAHPDMLEKKMNIPANLKYSKTDEWYDPETGKIGLTDFAQSQLSDIVFVEIIVSKGEAITVGKQIASVESVKAAADSYAPVEGKVAEVNEELSNNPEILNKDPYVAGWMAKVEGGKAGGLMDAAAYIKYCEERKS